MRKAMFTALLSLTAVAAGAQTMYDGLTFSQNNYYGTARSIGMGNAMTAVGGDHARRVPLHMSPNIRRSTYLHAIKRI